MKYLCILLGFTLVSCTSYQSFFIGHIDSKNKSILVPSGASFPLKDIKNSLLANGWTLHSTPSYPEENATNVAYVLLEKSTCYVYRDRNLLFDDRCQLEISIIDRKTNREVASADGYGFPSAFMKKFISELNEHTK